MKRSVQQDGPAILIEILLNREMRTKQGGVHQMVQIHTHYLLWFLRCLHLLQLTMWWSDKIPTASESPCILATKRQVDQMQPTALYFLFCGIIFWGMLTNNLNFPVIDLSTLFQGDVNVPSWPNFIFGKGNMRHQQRNMHARVCSVQPP